MFEQREQAVIEVECVTKSNNERGQIFTVRTFSIGNKSVPFLRKADTHGACS